ncbi:MAG: hypothetical protein ACFFD4_31660 [Candidatus Odinarchaeota archaeon]
MVLFCDTCGSLLLPRRSSNGQSIENMALVCSNCGNTTRTGDLQDHYTIITGSGSATEKRTIIIDSSFSSLPVMGRECPRCKNPSAYYTEIQDFKVEEFETALVYRCTACNHVFKS